nr:ADP-ribosylation factor [Colletotrichum truncatum]KAF6792397.1 ADP-ribosylation factor [Colletotrichum truncatum]
MSPRSHDDLWTRFLNLDQKAIYDQTVKEANSDHALNFVVDFSYSEARIAFDLSSDEFETLLGQKPPEGTVRWINIWSPGTQRPAVEKIGTYYGFSPRLQALMTAARKPNFEQASAAHASGPSDIEIGSVSNEKKLYSSIQTSTQVSDDVEIYQLVKETMNYTSIDHGKKFLCVGANWLHRRPGIDNTSRKPSLLPPKHWSWLTLCSDSVVLSFHEIPPCERNSVSWVEEELRNMRSNTVAVLCQLSNHGDKDYRDRVITLKSVRQTMPKDGPDCEKAREGSSNLFFYLFEDYSGAAPILKAARDEIHSLSEHILTSTSRRSKLKSGDVIRPLHTLRKELRQLHHLFESYKSLIRHICNRPQSEDDQRMCLCDVHQSQGGILGIKISTSARSRFDRLGDRLQLLMLNTIQEYLEELNALSGTYFNLTAQKDSQATARLSRSATVLAKLSVFFLPITFMTSYFSVEIPDLVEHYTPKMYWICFSVIAGLSFISLFFFSRMLEFLSDVLEGWADAASRKFRRLCGFCVHDEKDEH